jgi:hypothetical protein
MQRLARHKARIEKKKTKVRSYGILIKVLVPLLIILSVVLYLKLSTRYWNGHDKMAFAFQNSDGVIGVTVLDPALNEETTLIIPGDTEVNVARNYGTLKIKNVWQLGEDEKLGGSLLAQTLTDTFLFPTNLWSDRDLSDIWKFVFTTKETNIPFGDRLAAGIFALKVAGIDKTTIDLGQSQFLHKQILTDGSKGYVMSGPESSRLTVYFADNAFANENLRFALTDATGQYGVSNGVGAILEVLGGKVVEVDKKAEDDSLDCQVLGNNSDAVNKITNLFDCKKILGSSNFDLEMRIGGQFAKRF